MAAHRAAVTGEPLRLPARTASFGQWASRLADYGRSERLAAELPFWLGQRWELAAPLPCDSNGAATVASSRQVRIALPERETEALLRRTGAGRVRPDELCLAALAMAVSQWSGTTTFLADVEGHGRHASLGDLDHLDLTRTMGWFTSLHPLLVTGVDPDDPLRTLDRVVADRRAGFRRPALPGGPGAADRFGHLPRPPISFNFLGRVRPGPVLGERRPGAPAAGLAAAGHNPRSHLLGVTGWLAAGRLEAAFHYSVNRHQPDTMAALAAGFRQALVSLVVADPARAGR